MPKHRDDKPGRIGDYWLSKRPNSAMWCRTWFDAASRQTRRASLGTDDFQRAQVELARWYAANGTIQDAAPETLPLATILVRYWEHQAKHLKSADQARHALRKWTDHFGEATVQEITPARIRDFRRALEAQGLSAGYVRRTLAVGAAALNRAVKEGEITRAPHVQLPREGEPRERILSRDEARLLFRAAEPDHLRLYLVLAFATGARPSAILELTTFQLDHRAGLIRLNPPGRPQDKKRRPTLPMIEAVRPILRDLPPGPVIQFNGKPLASIRTAFRQMKRNARRICRRDGARLALSLWRDGRRADAWKAVQDARAAAEALDDISPYTIRHTVATEMRAAGVPLWEVAGWLGHSTGYKTTERYAKYGADYLGQAASAVQDYLADLLSVVFGDATAEPCLNPVRTSCVRARPKKLVEPRGIEPLTSTMPL